MVSRAEAICLDGLLVIEARRESVANPRFDPASRDWSQNREFAEYTSACVLTRGKHEWKYGKLVMRGRIDVRAAPHLQTGTSPNGM